MALIFSKTKANIQKHYYTVYMRAAGTAIASTDYDTLANWNTFLALFTEIGYCENKQVKIDVVDGEAVEIDEGEELVLDYEGSLEIKFLQNDSADYSALEDMEGQDVDLLLVSSRTSQFIYVHNQRFRFEYHVVSGEIDHAIIKGKKIVTEKSGTNGFIHTMNAIPAS